MKKNNVAEGVKSLYITILKYNGTVREIIPNHNQKDLVRFTVDVKDAYFLSEVIYLEWKK